MTQRTLSLDTGEVWQPHRARAAPLLGTLKCAVMRFPCLIWLGTVSAVTHDVIRRVGQRCSGKSTVILSGKCQGKVLSDRKRVCVSVRACVCGWVRLQVPSCFKVCVHLAGWTPWVAPVGVTLSMTTPFHVLVLWTGVCLCVLCCNPSVV